MANTGQMCLYYRGESDSSADRKAEGVSIVKVITRNTVGLEMRDV